MTGFSFLKNYILGTISLLIIPVAVQAGLMTSLAELSSSVDGFECPQWGGDRTTPASSTPEECDCNISESPLCRLRKQTEPITESLYFASIAERRKQDLTCVKDYLSSLDGNTSEKDALLDDLANKTVLFAEVQANLVNRMGRIGTLHQRWKYARGDNKAELERQLQAQRAELQKEQAAILAIKSSMPLIHLPGIHDVFHRYKNRITDKSVRIVNQDKPAAETMEELDKEAFKRDMLQAIQSSKSLVNRDIGTMNSAVESGGASLDRSLKESLAQDYTLIERLFQENPSLAGSTQDVACSADSTYGSGAQSRDAILNFGGIAITLASFGVGGLIRGSAAAGSAIFNGSRIAAVRGLFSIRSARIMSAVTIGLDSAAGVNEIGRACFGEQLNINVTNAQQCDNPSFENRSKDNCALAAGLTALGITAGSRVGQEFLGRIIAGVRRSLPNGNLSPALASRLEEYNDADELPGGAGGPFAAGLNEGRFLRTNRIRDGDLPYDSTLRDPRDIRSLNSLEDVPRVEITPTNVILTSDSHSGSAGVVRLATLPDGRPVAIKAYEIRRPAGAEVTPEEMRKIIEEEVRGLMLADDLGIGPRFHGLYTDEYGRVNVVMDVVTGDFSTAVTSGVTGRTLADLDTMFRRMHDAGISGSLGDFQYYVTNNGRLQVIDAAALGQRRLYEPRTPDRVRDFTRNWVQERVILLGAAEPQVGITYLESIRARNINEYRQTLSMMIEWARASQPYRRERVAPYVDYLRSAVERERRSGN